jgi:hypothetical protein
MLGIDGAKRPIRLASYPILRRLGHLEGNLTLYISEVLGWVFRNEIGLTEINSNFQFKALPRLPKFERCFGIQTQIFDF